MNRHPLSTWRDARRLALPALCLALALAPRVHAVQDSPAAGDPTALSTQAAQTVARYHAVALLTDMSADRFSRAVGLGTLTLEPASGAFQVDVSESRMDLVQSCPAPPDVCRRSIRSRHTRRLFEAAGQYRRPAAGQIAFDITGSGGAVETVLGYTDGDGSVIVVPFPHGNGIQLVLALADRPGAAAWPAGPYAWSRRVADFSHATVGASSQWPTHATGIAAGTVVFAGQAARGALSGSEMTARVSCHGEAACNLSALLDSEATFETVAARVSATAGGGLRLAGRHEDARYDGYADPSGNLVVLTGADEHGRQSLSLLTRRGTDASAADLQGEYSVVTLEEFVDTEGHVRTFQPTGTLLFDGAGQWSFNGANTVVDRADCTAAPALPAESSGHARCGTAAIQTLGPVNAGAAGTYTVSRDGDVTQQGIDTGGGAVNFTGSVTSDGRVFVLRRVEDALPCTFFCLGHESVRSLVIGIRKN